MEFSSKEEAKNAFKALQHSHLYSRRLVIEYAKSDGASADAVTDIDNKRQKTA